MNANTTITAAALTTAYAVLRAIVNANGGLIDGLHSAGLSFGEAIDFIQAVYGPDSDEEREYRAFWDL